MPISRMEKKIDVDRIWMTLKPFGRYQIGVMVYILICSFQVAVIILNYVIIGYIPAHLCSHIQRPLSDYGIETTTNASEFNIIYKECEIQLYRNHTNETAAEEHVLQCEQGYSYDPSVGKSIISEWDLVCNRQGVGELGQLLVMTGQIVGAIVFTSLADRYGRKPVFISTATLYLILSFALAFVPNFVMFAVLRFVLGALQQGMALTACTITVELFPQQYRGRIAALLQYCWTLYVVIISGIGYLMRTYSWRYVQIATSALATVSLASFWIVDESLQWLIANNKINDAMTIIKKIAKRNRVSVENCDQLLYNTDHEDNCLETNCIQSYTCNADDDLVSDADLSVNPMGSGNDTTPTIPSEHYTVLDIVRHKTMLKYSLVMWFVWFVNSLTYFGLYLISTPLTGNRFLDFFLNGLAELPGGVMYMLLVDRLGRRKTSIAFHSMTGVALVISTLLYTYKGTFRTMTGVALVISMLLYTYKGESQLLHVVSVVLNYVGKIGVAGSFALLFLYTPEMYPTNLRNIGVGICSSSARVGGMIAPYSNFFASLVLWGPGVVFGACCIIVALLSLILPETKGRELPKTIEEIANWRDSDNVKKTSFLEKNYNEQ